MAPRPNLDGVQSAGKAANAAKNEISSSDALPADCVQVDGKLYSASKLARWHPGGEIFVRAFSGFDASEAFLSYHRRKFPHASMTEFAVGTKKASKADGVDADYLELCDIVEKVLPRHKSFAPFSYYVKVLFLVSSALGLELYMHTTVSYKWYLSGLLGLFMALIGLNIQHDANHGAVSRNSWVNRLLGMTQNWIGGSAVDWIHQHVVQHHVNCNDVNHDPDIVGSDLLRLNPLKPLLGHQVFQHLYMFLLLSLFGFSVTVESLRHIVNGHHHKDMSALLASHRVLDASTSILFFLRWIVLPLYQAPSIFTFLNLAPLFIVAGYYLSFFFIISHNFIGAHMFDRDAAGANPSFLYKQVTSSSNVGGAWLCFLNGGLNYQIEHHLFPRIQHTHYPTIAPVVREFCKKKGLPYVHFPTVLENMSSTVKHLSDMGNDLSPKGLKFGL